MSSCPCGSGAALAACCGSILAGERAAATADELMRARYSAFATGAVDFILDSHHPETRDTVDRGEIAAWSSGSEWLGFEIEDQESGESADEATITFIARYRQAGQTVRHRERSYFRREADTWYFHSVLATGEDEPELVPVAPAASAGRNDPCPCGSGRKYKRCHGA